MSDPRIVIVEDNPSEVYILRRALLQQAELNQEEAIHLEVFADGEEALRYVHAQRDQHLEHPCVMVLDLHLPRYDGLEVLRAIRKEPALSHVQVVVMTTASSPKEEAEIRALGAHYRLKPKDLPDFDGFAADLIAICQGLVTTEESLV